MSDQITRNLDIIGCSFARKWLETIENQQGAKPMVDDDSPTELDVIRSCGGFAAVGADKLSLSYPTVASHDYDVGAVQANRPTPSNCFMYYFEITVKDAGAKGKIGIGFSTEGFDLRRQPGWEPKSYGYHGDDGHLYHVSGAGQTFGPTFTTGDTVGAGIIYGDRQIFFTKNGHLVGTVPKDPAYGPMYPTIGLHSQNEEVTVNFGNANFVFDHKAYESEQRAKQHTKINSVIMQYDPSNFLVRSYLLYYGYQETLELFDMAGEALSPPPGAFMEDYEYALNQRMTLRQLIRHGHIDEAVTKLKEWYPQILHRENHIGLLLLCQKFIELVRIGKVEEAVQLGRREFEKFKELIWFTDLSKECAALLAYEDASNSPVGYLLWDSQREMVADAVNAAVISTNPQMKELDSWCFSPLEAIIRRTTTNFSKKIQRDGMQGEPFDLRRFLAHNS